MSNYSKSTNFATKDNLTPGDPLKIVRGTEIDTEFNNIATAIATKTDNASAAIAGGTINDTTIGATTASTGAFTTLAASGAVTLSGGTANGVAYLNGSKVVTSGSALTFDGSNLGVGTSSPAYKLDVIGVFGSGNGTITSGFSYDTGGLVGTFSNHALGVLTNGNVVAKFDTSGNLLVGTTSTTGERIQVIGTSGAGTMSVQVGANGNNGIGFRNASGTSAGSITVNASTVAYNTSSDYRLKNTISPMTGALAKVAQLKPVTYKWNADGSNGQGFIAHELAEVCPDAVTGEKDGTRIEQYEISPAVAATYDEDGNELTSAIEAVMGEREVPQYQGIDVSFLVATLTAAIQELKAEFDAYKASHP